MSSNCIKVSLLKAGDELSLLGSEATMYKCSNSCANWLDFTALVD